MRLINFLGMGVTAVVLAGCVAPTAMQAPVSPVAPAAPAAPTTLDAASRQVARNVINSEMQNRLPGVNVSPYTDCVVNNATTAELIDLAQASRAGVSGTADSVASIVSRPATSQCIASAAQTA
ncbi:hypothetical protein [Paracoccus homiensis]|uniref:Succinate dehydrogenase n=1 Tax=Paracoccus homiensis TaxID=364199 RepID=A0A1I0F8B9_9RHOB|nr:hypothetical protein [Paracoccus homiensis]SET54129.1 hypothetical protein SAMN04489858_106121 [Paracoccus homiensis]